MKIDIVLLMNHMILCSLTFHLSKQHHRTNDDGSLNQHYTNDTGETPDRSETKISTKTSETVCVEALFPETGNLHLSNQKNAFQLRERLLRTFIAFGGYFKHTANGLRKIAGLRFEECRKPVHTLSMKQKETHTIGSLSVEEETHSLDYLPGEVEHGFTFEELVTATNGFRKLLGQGGFGFTYRGILSDGRHVVIKRSRDKSRALQRELECITNLKHPNILDLVGSCITGDELLLLFDYMANEDLSSLLFEPRDNQVLDWPTRKKIINGVASALVYLQESADVCIVHGDIKPTNILIDEDFNAKVSDFGIARKHPEAKSMDNKNGEEEGVYVDFEESSNDPHHSTGAAGTVGYVAPECIRTGQVTKKADIYNVGLLMLNLISGKRCIEIDGVTNKMQSLVLLANKLSDEDRLGELIDPRLLKTRGFDSESILRTTHIALLCSHFQAEYRPTTSDMFKFLSSESSPFHIHNLQEQQEMIKIDHGLQITALELL
ncbi:probable serine/threonine-protein kinase PBL23 [Cryptomeria japonica]|uniref:probable serine/threonine-protein kinase PBL23 n=1 Tax=Cryptomeria japonica TaxID=3369 RepID=UPI0027DA6A55|nr:probable serine/threonine-protein kinase PBL23 [Cryptomeria japonica]